MARVVAGNVACKGRTDATKMYGDVDDGVYTHTLPFSFVYNGISVNKLYISTNLYVGFGSDTQHLKVCQRDGRSYGIYVEETPEFCRVRFEGRSVYNGSTSTDTTYELTVHPNGVMLLAIEKSPRNGTDAFETLSGAGTAVWHAGKSYGMEPGADGKKWTIHQESHVIYMLIKYLVEDTDGLKKYNFETNQWDILEETVVTEELIAAQGHEGGIPTLDGLTVSNPTLYSYADTLEASPGAITYAAIPKWVELKQVQDYVVTTEVKNIEFITTVPDGAVLMMLISVDGGTTWNTFKNSEWSTVAYISPESIKAGVTNTELTLIPAAAWKTILGESQTLRFAYYLEGNTGGTFPSLDRLRINYL